MLGKYLRDSVRFWRFKSTTVVVQLMLIMALGVVSLGAYTRLKDAGLGCPDWPGCYGNWRVEACLFDGIEATKENVEKAWIEMIHRYAAGLLGVGILGLALFNVRVARRTGVPTGCLPWALVALLIFQAALGMWTVTLRLYPIVVMGHLLGGLFITLGLGWWLFSSHPPSVLIKKRAIQPTMRVGIVIGLGVLLCQVVLGGWTSANYAALVCLEFPLCQGLHNPPTAWQEAFNFVQAGNPGSPGTPLSFLARATVHMAHRYWAMVTIVVIVWNVTRLWRVMRCQRFYLVLSVILLSIQVGLGIINVWAYLPLFSAWSHHLVAILLLLSWLKVLHICSQN